MVKKGLLLVLLVIFSYSVMAQDLETFGATEMGIAPPPPPETAADELERFDAELLLKDYNTKELISDIHITVELYDKTNNKITKTIKYVGEDGLLKLGLEPVLWDIVLKVDELTTLGKDYYFKSNYDVSGNFNDTIYVLPVGSVKGIVYDKSGDVISDANIKFECGSSYGELEEKTSDKYGSFVNYWLPVGTCRVTAMYGKAIGFNDVELRNGDLTNLDITLNKSLVKNRLSLIWIAIVALLFIVAYLAVPLFRKKDNLVVKEIDEGKTINKREKDILGSLKEREKKVVNFLLEHDNKSNQANIINNTGIPKTTMHRVFDSLESRNIIKIEKIGKLKKVELTGWFLDKE
ncbi:hypothetical protein HQ529_02390 [Candidatus Woesearchaeota archaeon]|nr:hypothetical protein [Candidatus Woesearchaeota archaeon]